MFIIYFCLLIKLSSITAQLELNEWSTARTKLLTKRNAEELRFKDYLQKFDPRSVHERVERVKNSTEKNYTSEKYIDLMVNGIDEADDLLKLKFDDVVVPSYTQQPTPEMIEDARRWHPPPGSWNPYTKDPFYLRARIYELMKQAVYQARNSLVIMQLMREKYRHSSLYKMGFLMAKTDNSVRTFAKFAYRAIRFCGIVRQWAVREFELYHLLILEERLLHLWSNSLLLIELLRQNDIICHDMLDTNENNRLSNWKFKE